MSGRNTRLISGVANEPQSLSERVKIIPTGTTTLKVEDHANRLLLIDPAAVDDGVIIILPRATGTGDVYRVLNPIMRTTSGLLFKVDVIPTTNLMNVMVKSLDSTAVATDTSSWFMTNATQISLNVTTTGGLGGDYFEFVDGADGTWYVRGETRCSGDKATPLTAAS
jgi:hypothetical protein